MPNKGIIMLNGRQYGDSGTNYNVVKCTQQEYDAMTPEQKNNGCLYIVLGSTTNSVNYLGTTVAGNTNQASGVSYDDSQTQLGATNVQDAIGRINADLTESMVTTSVTSDSSGNVRVSSIPALSNIPITRIHSIYAVGTSSSHYFVAPFIENNELYFRIKSLATFNDLANTTISISVLVMGV